MCIFLFAKHMFRSEPVIKLPTWIQLIIHCLETMIHHCFSMIHLQVELVVLVVVVFAAIGEVVVEVGATFDSPGHHGIEARRRTWVHRFSSAPWVYDPPVGY